MRRFLAAALIAGLVLSGIGCNDGDFIILVKLSEANNGGVIDVPQGSEVVVILSGNPTTGYQWELVQNDESRLKFVDSSYTPGSGGLGGGGEYHFRFTTTVTGEVPLHLVYKQPWSTEAAQTFAVTIIIS